MSPLRSTLVLLATAATFGLAACGGSSDGGSSSASSGGGAGGPLSRAELAKQANAICKDAKASVAKLAAPTSLGTDADALAKGAPYLEQVAAVSRKESDAFSALQPDAEAKDDWAQVIKGQQQLADLIENVAANARKKNPDALKDLGSSAALGKPFTDAMTKIGAKDCFNA